VLHKVISLSRFMNVTIMASDDVKMMMMMMMMMMMVFSLVTRIQGKIII